MKDDELAKYVYTPHKTSQKVSKLFFHLENVLAHIGFYENVTELQMNAVSGFMQPEIHHKVHCSGNALLEQECTKGFYIKIIQRIFDIKKTI